MFFQQDKFTLSLQYFYSIERLGITFLSKILSLVNNIHPWLWLLFTTPNMHFSPPAGLPYINGSKVPGAHKRLSTAPHHVLARGSSWALRFPSLSTSRPLPRSRDSTSTCASTSPVLHILHPFPRSDLYILTRGPFQQLPNWLSGSPVRHFDDSPLNMEWSPNPSIWNSKKSPCLLDRSTSFQPYFHFTSLSPHPPVAPSPGTCLLCANQHLCPRIPRATSFKEQLLADTPSIPEFPVQAPDLFQGPPSYYQPLCPQTFEPGLQHLSHFTLYHSYLYLSLSPTKPETSWKQDYVLVISASSTNSSKILYS